MCSLSTSAARLPVMPGFLSLLSMCHAFPSTRVTLKSELVFRQGITTDIDADSSSRGHSVSLASGSFRGWPPLAPLCLTARKVSAEEQAE